ncbi:LysR substrate-binding domain-containing protein [Consotaella salsifontis]|uniref:Transcriptional regulator, LysR family n=1 Tax=Consotaella salsifontis TaxID=1365950 RepID=A0A1T4QN11_9HYPH|nr:LysR substrate-binding domain-containing protein [Consotaella salsifontis]SKA04841.1 transcriptional regulator, LysR family [Consotaella salsifontis]
MHDLNDLYYFEAVVRNGGFSAAARDIGVSKSILSRRVREMEDELGIRLIDRSNRLFKVTEIGQQIYERCRAAVGEMARAQEIAAAMTEEPRGDLTVTCPPGRCADIVSTVVLEMMERYERLRIHLIVSAQRFNIIEDNIDVAIRGGPLQRPGELDLVVKRVLDMSSGLVASPELIGRLGEPKDPVELISYPTIGRRASAGTETWELRRDDGEQRAVRVAPRMSSTDLVVHLKAAEHSGGIAFLPDFIACHRVRAGTLVRVLPEWKGLDGSLHIAFPSRRGMLPAVREFIDAIHPRLVAAFREPYGNLAESEIELASSSAGFAPLSDASLTPTPVVPLAKA